MKKREKEEHFAAHVPGVLQYHQLMLQDEVRNELLYKAIKQCVGKDTSFLDVGAGTGVWAILAAKLGAKRVVAIEIEECLIPIIYKHAQENGVADRIEIIHGSSDDMKLRGKFDVIVSELFGSDALGKRVVDSFVHLRDRFLAPGGTLIPQELVTYAVPVHLARSVDTMPAKLPISCEFMKSLKLNYPSNASLDERGRMQRLADPKPLMRMDFRTITAAHTHVSAEWKLRNISKVNAFAMFTGSVFTDKIRMSGFDSQSWGTTVYEFEPFSEKAGTIRFDLAMDEQKSIWTVSVPSNTSLKAKTQSPAFALARLRLSQKMTPYRRVKPERRS